MADDKDLLKEAKDAFRSSHDAENHNRQTYLDDVRFAREAKQWEDTDVKARKDAQRPTLTINKLEAVIRQVVNDARMNKPSIQCLPADSNADPDTAEVMEGLIRNIEYTSNADVAFDTATECAVSGGFGYFRVDRKFAYEDAFQMDLMIEAIPNPLSVYGDPTDQGADSANWNDAFIVDRLTKAQWEAQWKGRAKTDWGEAEVWGNEEHWRDESTVQIAEWFHREEYEKPIYLVADMSNNGSTMVFDKETVEKPEIKLLFNNGILQLKQERTTKCFKVKQHLMTGAEILETTDWPGKYIPIVPVYGLDFNVEGKRYLRSLIYNAKDSQRQFNFWRSQATEVASLATKVSYIGKKGAFDHDQARWNTANTVNHPYIEYEGNDPPMRQPLDMGPAAGALQEAMNASEDIKATTGLFDASMGAKSNETSGKAIIARQREGDVSTFHFQDNMSRAIRHLGRILDDLIPKDYSGERMIRVLGEDKAAKNVQLGKETPVTDKNGQPMQQPVMGPDGQPAMDANGTPQMQAIMRTFDLTVGKYDVVVKTGPSFTTRREEAANQMLQLIQAFPQAASIVGPELAKNLDWPGADDIAEKMEAQAGMPDPEQIQQQIQEAGQKVQQLEEENQNLKMDQSVQMKEAENDLILQQQKNDLEHQLNLQKLEDQKQVELAKVDLQRDVAVDNYNMAVEQSDRDHQLNIGKAEKPAVMAEVKQLAKLMDQNQQELREQIDRLARIVAAPTELIRDPKTNKATGARKVLN